VLVVQKLLTVLVREIMSGFSARVSGATVIDVKKHFTALMFISVWIVGKA
jgi:hypothetical protein